MQIKRMMTAACLGLAGMLGAAGAARPYATPAPANPYGQPAAQPAAGSYAQPAAQPAQGGAVAPAAQPGASPYTQPAAQPSAAPRGVYQQYRPQAAKTPEPQSGQPEVARVSIHQDSVGIALKGGLAARLGEEAKFHTGGWGAGAEIHYKAAPSLSAAFLFQYVSIPYSLSTAAQPLGGMGFGVKAVYELFNVEGVVPFVQGGLGYFTANRATQVLKGYDGTGLPLFETKYQQAGGMGFLGGLGAAYEFTPRFRLLLDLTVTSVSLAGGTGDNILFASPGAGILYTF